MFEPDWEPLMRDADEQGKTNGLVRGLAYAVRYLMGCREELRRANGELAGLRIEPNYGNGVGVNRRNWPSSDQAADPTAWSAEALKVLDGEPRSGPHTHTISGTGGLQSMRLDEPATMPGGTVENGRIVAMEQQFGRAVLDEPWGAHGVAGCEWPDCNCATVDNVPLCDKLATKTAELVGRLGQDHQAVEKALETGFDWARDQNNLGVRIMEGRRETWNDYKQVWEPDTQ